MAAIGSPDWVARTGGALSLRDQVLFAAQAIAAHVNVGVPLSWSTEAALSAGAPLPCASGTCRLGL